MCFFMCVYVCVVRRAERLQCEHDCIFAGGIDLCVWLYCGRSLCVGQRQQQWARPLRVQCRWVARAEPARSAAPRLAPPALARTLGYGMWWVLYHLPVCAAVSMATYGTPTPTCDTRSALARSVLDDDDGR